MIARAKLLWQLAAARVLLWIAGAGHRGEIRPEVHTYLAELHLALAAEYTKARKWRVARRHQHLAEAHDALGVTPEPPPAAALAMPVPRPPTFVDARSPQSRWPDDVA